MVYATLDGLVRAWLVTPDNFDKMPAGTVFMVSNAETGLPEPFTGKLVVFTKQSKDDGLLIAAGWEPARKGETDIYPTGVPIFDLGMIFSWETKIDVDPCNGIPDEAVLKSVAMRKLVVSPKG